MSDLKKTWQAKLIDVGDGTGDAFIELPDELLKSLSWVEGDKIKIQLVKEA